MKSLLQEIKKRRVLVSDGAWGTLLQERGLQLGECPESWNRTHRNDVLAIARSYIDAGADMILTNSFGGNPAKLGHFGLQDQCAQLNEAAAAISREAAGSDHFVLGSMGPTGLILLMSEIPEETIYEGFSIQAKALQKGGVDALCIETMSALDEACLAIRAARENTDCEIACTFTFEKTVNGDYRTMMGVSPSDMARAITLAGASIIGANCGDGLDGMVDIVREIREVDSTTPLLIHANAGKPVFRDGKTVFPETPEMMADKVCNLIKAGASIVGGCCGTTPQHIRALVQAIEKCSNE